MGVNLISHDGRCWFVEPWEGGAVGAVEGRGLFGFS
jgi:hypothetical protein